MSRAYLPGRINQGCFNNRRDLSLTPRFSGVAERSNRRLTVSTVLPAETCAWLKISLASSLIVTIIVTVMAKNVQFSIAVHIMAGLAYGCSQDQTSRDLASSVNTSPSFVRRVLAKLSRAGLVETATGKAGACWLAKNPKKISLLDIYKAVEAPEAIAIHSYEEQKNCPVSRQIKAALERALGKTQKAMEASLRNISLAEIVSDVKKA
jgi:Rrf2 family protein